MEADKFKSEKKYKRLFKITFSFLIVITTILTVVCVFLTFQAVIINRKSGSDSVCTTQACIKAAHQILENLDSTVDPCDDFHMFSCGSFIKNQRIPEDQSKLDVFDVLRIKLGHALSDLLDEPANENDIDSTIKAKKFYKSCMNEDLVNAQGEMNFLKIIDTEFGGWPLISEQKSSLTIIERMVILRKIGFKPLIDIHVTSNPKNPVASILKIKQPSWYLNRHYYDKNEFELVYKEYFYKYVSFLKPDFNRNDKRIDRMFKLEKELAMHQTNEDLRRNSTYKNVTLKKLIKDIPSFDWKEFIFNGIYRNITDSVDISLDEPIIVDDYEYLVNACKFLSSIDETNKTDIENLMIWSAIRKEVFFLPKKYKEAKIDFDKYFKGAKSSPPREIVCSYFVLEAMDFAVGRLYVMKHFNDHSKKAASEIIQNLKSEFIQILKETDWLDDESRELALDKADFMDSKVGYPDFILNGTFMNEIYQKYIINDRDYFNNSINILKIEVRHSFEELRKKKDRELWISSPAVVNAFYSPYSNQICFPAGILQAPFYDADFPNYLNYGGIGSVIGHEITHGFDDRGRLHDKNGVYHDDGTKSLWTAKTISNYRAKSKCIIDQYSNYTLKQINKTLNGIITQGENIADNGGLKESFRAYLKWSSMNAAEPLLPGLNYNQNQLFFINYAQVWCSKYRDQYLFNRLLGSNHSPGEFRVIGPTSNLKEFADVFNCKPNQRNNPTQKCTVW